MYIPISTLFFLCQINKLAIKRIHFNPDIITRKQFQVVFTVSSILSKSVITKFQENSALLRTSKLYKFCIVFIVKLCYIRGIAISIAIMRDSLHKEDPNNFQTIPTFIWSLMWKIWLFFLAVTEVHK